MTKKLSTKNSILPKKAILLISVISTLPLILHLAGIDFSSPQAIVSPDVNFQRKMAGEFLHVILEWSAVALAIITAIFAFLQYKITGSISTPIVGMALFCSGFMDAFHTLAATYLLPSMPENENFIPFTWTLSRTFNTVILFIGTGMFLLKIKLKLAQEKRKYFILLVCAAFVLLSFLIIEICSASANLPQTTFKNNIVSRPYDIIPLVLFLILGLWIFPKFCRYERDIFSQTLILSSVPAVATQLHMAFGSRELYDAHFNIAHFLKAISYFVPFFGIIMNYLYTYRAEKQRSEELEFANKELQEFSYILSHDLKAPLRAIGTLSDIIDKENADKLTGESKEYLKLLKNRATRLDKLMDAALMYSLLGIKSKKTSVDLNEVTHKVIRELEIANHITVSIPQKLPLIVTDQDMVTIVFKNLIDNAIHNIDKKNGFIIISFRKKEKEWEFSISDNGVGIEEIYFEKIFKVFQSLESRDKRESLGMGLAVVNKIIKRLKGKVWVRSEVGKGTTFYFTLPKE